MLTIDVETLRATAAGSAFARGVAAHVLAACKRIHDEPAIVIEREPGRDVMLPTARRLFQRVTTLAVGDALAGGMRHRARGGREILAAAAFPDWNPGHFLDTAEMMAAVALGFFWFGPVMGGAERLAVCEALIDKGLRPGLEAFDADAFWVTARHNWNTVCCGGMIVAAVVLRQEAPALCDTVLARCRVAMAAGLSAYGEDGGYPEGPSYWEFATRYAALAHAALLEAGRIDWVSAPLAKSWSFARDMTAPSGDVFDCGDTDAQVPRSPVLGWLARISDDPAAACNAPPRRTLRPVAPRACKVFCRVQRRRGNIDWQPLLTRWRREYRGGGLLSGSASTGFVPLSISPPVAATCEVASWPRFEDDKTIEIGLPNGRRLTIPASLDPTILARLLPVLDAP